MFRWMTWPLVFLTRIYRSVVSPWLPPACRFDPSCSEYAETALSRHGVFRGIWLTARRLCRCHPWGGWGYDPVPSDAKRDGL